MRILTFILAVAASWNHAAAQGPLSYNRDVRPLLSKHCFSCHGPDEASREAGLRLDVPDGTGTMEADADELLRRIESTDPDEMMPPPTANKPIDDVKRAILKRWIDDGAPYEQHWSFVPPTRHPVPLGVHPIDHFVDAKLAAVGRHRSDAADPATLIRRLHLDLIGLPPTPEVADAFVADPSPQAYTAIVDDLLASPRYGERWARRWLDLARYADTNGYEKDRDRSIWPYRDWVIRAINDDVPFDQFTIEQIAGDRLPDPTVDQRVATGFHRNTMLNEEGGIDPLEFRYHAMTDRVATTGTTWLGLTTGCAQCHTHKYDPITHHDYFGIMAYLNNADEPDFFLPYESKAEDRQSELDQADKLESELASHWPAATKSSEQNLEAALATWIEKQRTGLAAWTTMVPTSMSANVPYLTLEDDGAIFAAGDTSKHDIYTVEFAGADFPIQTLRLEALADPRLPAGGPGSTYYEGSKGDFYLTEFELSNANSDPIEITEAFESFAKNTFGKNKVSAQLATDGDIQTGWSVDSEGAGKSHVAVFRLQTPIAAGSPFKLQMHFGRHYASSLGKFRISASEGTSIRTAFVHTNELATALANDDAAESPIVRSAFLMDAPELKEHADEIRKLREPKRGPMTLVFTERPPGHARPTYLHHRGEYTQPTETVEAHLPEVLWKSDQRTSDKSMPGNRLEFAQWLVSRDNPLTARVVVNRHWAAFFGTGIVSTLDDFGMQGEIPSHTELLDHLAVEFMDNGWSIKSLHQRIVTSGTYQQSSRVPASKAGDGVDRLLGRFPRNRLDAEIIRDSALATSGLLSDKMYGPPVRPPQPAGAVSANYKKSTWQASEGEDRYRRSVYTYQKRTAPFEMFTTFDAGSGEACLARRDVSNTPLQALTLMNDPMFVEIAQAYGKRMAAVEGDLNSKIDEGFRWLMTRLPTDTEREWIADFQSKHSDWTATARVLLCIDEAITKN
ncbi:Planctomycete cytochrome C [Rubripirellula tenax]|uniref:Planctomycete cytochrome C n=1 Tax=Rubripirellula tenax TaxID=2528015 RepID=A0A5C6FGU7_9BACT|nr:PSD1 and planctomycete cytochrome C domain-containing protein [Rubripirellula tenax]TWU60658.1 Planctomycete cytochrome C [Rubripirellula tenax]